MGRWFCYLKTGHPGHQYKEPFGLAGACGLGCSMSFPGSLFNFPRMAGGQERPRTVSTTSSQVGLEWCLSCNSRLGFEVRADVEPRGPP